MGNVLTTNPYVIDTAMSSSMKASNGLPQNIPIYVTQVYWLAPASASDTFAVEDGTGTVFSQGVCEVDGQSQVFPFVPPKSISDFKVSTLDSGTIILQTL